MSRVPNFLYIGTSKAGSTWIYQALAHHPDVYLSSDKGLYYFDGHYDRGESWYLSHFQEAGQRVLGEVSHSYLFSRQACRRIARLNPDMKLMVCLREPVERAFSDYLDKIKNNQAQGPFETVCGREPALIERGKYATYLSPYLEQFGRQNIHVGIFDELKQDPQAFASKMFRFLDLEEIELDRQAVKKRMPAARPRSRWMAQLAKKGSILAKRIGLRRLRTKVKTSVFVRGLLYRPYTEADKPKLAPETERQLRGVFRDEVRRLDSMLGADLATTWNYS